jgi:hypothetical protein
MGSAARVRVVPVPLFRTAIDFFPVLNWLNKPEHFSFFPPATPSNIARIDDEAHTSDHHGLAPGGPATRRDLASDPWTLIPDREALCASAHSLCRLNLPFAFASHQYAHCTLRRALPSAARRYVDLNTSSKAVARKE